MKLFYTIKNLIHFLLVTMWTGFPDIESRDAYLVRSFNGTPKSKSARGEQSALPSISALASSTLRNTGDFSKMSMQAVEFQPRAP